ncbi:hypothetical protein NEMIN01_2420, partial [Nematocida minor]|uniref:uncharacterized protein n=1 Tax=Nematocida minor TaxID=1912983 RepID=UPI0022205B82
MFTAEDLCRKGFYGVPIEEISKNEINQIVGAGKGEIVTGESVAAVKENLDPTLFRAPSGEENGLFIRPTNKEFTEYATKGRLKFNCPEYYFIFHELITNKDPIDCNVVRSKLKVGAKSFFYFIKKLCGAGLVKKEENKIFLTNNPVISNNQMKECSVPKEWLRNVPIYSQIVGLLHREEGVTTQDIKEYLGMSNKKANIALRHVLTGCTEIKTVTEFEGKIRRSRYILNTHYEKQKESFGANPGTDKNKKQSDSINTEIRTKVIEDLVAREKAIVYNQYFHRSISEILGSKHTIDKNTVIRTANASKVINLVQVYIKYPTKTITRNVFKVVGISDTDPAVIRSIQNEGYKRFSIITKNGVVDYHFESKEDSEDREEKEESEEY